MQHPSLPAPVGPLPPGTSLTRSTRRTRASTKELDLPPVFSAKPPPPAAARNAVPSFTPVWSSCSNGGVQLERFLHRRFPPDRALPPFAAAASFVMSSTPSASQPPPGTVRAILLICSFSSYPQVQFVHCSIVEILYLWAISSNFLAKRYSTL